MERSERLQAAFAYVKSLGKAHTQKDAAERMGASPPNFSAAIKGNAKVLTDKFLRRFNTAYGNIFNEEWLIDGAGEMLAKSELVDISDVDNALWLPVINLDTRGGLLPNNEMDGGQYVMGQMPFSRDIAREGDFVMPVIGDSMTPKYPNGTFVLVRPLPTWREYIELGATYILELLDGRRVIKDVRAGQDREHFRLCSVNPAYDPSEVAKSFIARIYAVIVSVRRELNW